MKKCLQRREQNYCILLLFYCSPIVHVLFQDKDNEPYKNTASSNHKVADRSATSLNQVHLNINNDSTHIEVS